MARTTRRDLVKPGAAAAAAAALTGGIAPAPVRAGRGHKPRGLPVGYPLGPFTRDRANPILEPGTQPWEAKFVFDPAARVKEGLVRAQGPDGLPGASGSCTYGQGDAGVGVPHGESRTDCG